MTHDTDQMRTRTHTHTPIVPSSSESESAKLTEATSEVMDFCRGMVAFVYGPYATFNRLLLSTFNKNSMSVN